MITPEQEEEKKQDELVLYLEELGHKDEDELATLLHKTPLESARLLIAIGAFATKACGNMNKLYEMVTVLELAAEYSKETHEIIHVKHSYGPDIVIMNKETLKEEGQEIKHSMTNPKKGNKTNWSFSVDSKQLLKVQKDPRVENIALLIISIYSTQVGGLTHFIAREDTTLLQHYKVSAAFMSLYCVKKLLSATCKSVNLGCQICSQCGHYHRILHLREWGEVLEKRILETDVFFEYRLCYFTPIEWIAILKDVKSQCKK